MRERTLLCVLAVIFLSHLGQSQVIVLKRTVHSSPSIFDPSDSFDPSGSFDPSNSFDPFGVPSPFDQLTRSKSFPGDDSSSAGPFGLGSLMMSLLSNPPST